MWDALLARLADVFAGYVAAQVAAGADVIQLFDSWVGVLSPTQYRERAAVHSARVLGAVDVPTIHFGTGAGHLLEDLAAAGGDAIGLDWRTPLDEGWARVPDRAVQGNLDPAALLAGWETVEREALDVLRQGRWAPRARVQPRPRRAPRHRPGAADAAGGARPRPHRGAGGRMRPAVVLMAYGSPDRLADVPAYYADIRGGRTGAPGAARRSRRALSRAGNRRW